MRKDILSELSSAGYASENFCQIMLRMAYSKIIGAMWSEFGNGGALVGFWIDTAKIKSGVESGK